MWLSSRGGRLVTLGIDPNGRRGDERHLARAIVHEEIERIDRVDLDRELDQHVELGDPLARP